VLWGLHYAVAVSIVSMLVFNWFFLPPVHTFDLEEPSNWTALLVYLATAVVTSELAARMRRRAAEAERRERDAALLADLAARPARAPRPERARRTGRELVRTGHQASRAGGRVPRLDRE
jgi:two-component system sensor histidine kinase KdpD